jgi:hypothetical protein
VLISAAAASSIKSSPPELLHAVRIVSPPAFSLTPSRRAHRRTPAAGRPPPWTPYLDRHPLHPCKRVVEFARSQASRRHFPRPKPCPLTPFNHRRRTSGEVPARRHRGPAWRRRRAHACDHGRRSQPTAQIKRRNPPPARSTVDQWTWSTALVYDRAHRPIRNQRRGSRPARSMQWPLAIL